MTSGAIRVAMVDPAAFTPDYDHALCRELASAGAEVELLTSRFSQGGWPEPAGYVRRELFPAGSTRPSRQSFARLVGRTRRAAGWPAAWRRVGAAIERFRPDVLHLQWSPIPPLDRRYLARFAAAGLPLVVTVHNAEPHGDEPFGGFDRSPLFELASRVVVHSRFAAETMTRRHPRLESRLEWIPPGAEPPAPALSRIAARRELGLPAEAPLVLFAGLVRPYKGIDLLLAAFDRIAPDLPEAHLAIVGLPSVSVSALEESVARSRHAERIRLEPVYATRERFAAYLQAADVVALPYRGAAESAVLTTALAAGRAVVATRTGALPETIGIGDAGDGERMLVPPDDTAALALSLAGLLTDRGLRERLERRNAAEAARRFRWSDCAERTLEMYAAAARPARVERQAGAPRPRAHPA